MSRPAKGIHVEAGTGIPLFSSSRSRVVLADDHPDVIQELRELLSEEFEVAYSASHGLDLVDAVARLKPDVVVTDIQMPFQDGVESGRQILQRNLCGAVVLLTVFNDRQLRDRALAEGIRGYVLKVDAGEELIRAVQTVLAGGTYVSQGAVQKGR